MGQTSNKDLPELGIYLVATIQRLVSQLRQSRQLLCVLPQLLLAQCVSRRQRVLQRINKLDSLLFDLLLLSRIFAQHHLVYLVLLLCFQLVRKRLLNFFLLISILLDRANLVQIFPLTSLVFRSSI